MGLNIKNAEVEKLAAEIASRTHQTKTEVIRQALLEKQARLQAQAGFSGRGLREYFEQSVWPQIPQSEIGKTLTREEEDSILGYGSKVLMDPYRLSETDIVAA